MKFCFLHDLLGYAPSAPPLEAPPRPPRAPALTRRARSALPLHTGPIAPLAGRSLAVLSDHENVGISAGQLGYRIDYAALAARLGTVASLAAQTAVFSTNPGDCRIAAAIAAAGWTPLTRDIEHVRTAGGVIKAANADNLIAFAAGRLVASLGPGVDLLILSGDGLLVGDVARAVKTTSPRSVFAAAIPGSIHSRLRTPHQTIDAPCLEIGLDVLHSIAACR